MVAEGSALCQTLKRFPVGSKSTSSKSVVNLVSVSHQSSSPDPRRWLALAVLLSAILLGVLDFLIVNIALPSIRRDLNANNAQIQLTVAGYGLAFAVSLITGGRLGDIYGRKRLFLIGMTGFTLASLLCGFSQNALQLVVFRLIQGLLAALMSPQVLATVQVTFDGHERDIATGIIGAAVGVGSFLGNVLGGFLVGANLFGMGWRPIFFVNVPIGIIAIILAAFLVKESKSPLNVKLDIPGTLISGVALFCLIFPIAEGSKQGFPAWAFAMLAVSGVLTWYFLRFEKALAQRGGSPVVAMELFESQGFGRGLMGILFLCSGASSFSLTITMFLQDGLHVPPQQVGVIFSALSIAFLLSSVGAVALVARVGQKTLLLGLTIMQLGQAALIFMPLWLIGHPNPYLVMPVLFLYGIGQGMCMPQVTRQTLNQVGKNNAGAASGVLSTVQQVANTLGISVIGSVFFAVAGNGNNATSYAHALSITFVCNFLLVLIMRVMWVKNLKHTSVAPPSSPSHVAIEA